MGHTCVAWLEDEDRSGAAKGIKAILDYLMNTSGDEGTLVSPLDKVAMMYVWTEFAAYPPDTMDATCAAIPTNGTTRISKGVALKYLSDKQIYDYRENPLDWFKSPNKIVWSGFETDEATVSHYLGVVLIVSDGPVQSVGTPRITHHHIMTGGAAGAAAWTKITQTDVTTLEAGDYNMWGAEVIAATAVASRFIISGYNERPAVIPKTCEEDNLHSFSRFWGTPYKFKHPINTPTLELLDTTTSTSKITLFLEKVG